MTSKSTTKLHVKEIERQLSELGCYRDQIDKHIAAIRAHRDRKRVRIKVDRSGHREDSAVDGS